MTRKLSDVSVFETKKKAREILIKKQVDYSIWFFFTFFKDIKKIDGFFEYEEETTFLFFHSYTKIKFEINKNKYELIKKNQKITLIYNNEKVLIFKPTILDRIDNIEFVKLYGWVEEIYEYLKPREMSLEKRWKLEDDLRQKEELKNFDLGNYK